MVNVTIHRPNHVSDHNYSNKIEVIATTLKTIKRFQFKSRTELLSGANQENDNTKQNAIYVGDQCIRMNAFKLLFLDICQAFLFVSSTNPKITVKKPL